MLVSAAFAYARPCLLNIIFCRHSCPGEQYPAVRGRMQLERLLAQPDVWHALLLTAGSSALSEAADRPGVLQPVSYISLALTFATGTGLFWYFDRQREAKKQGALQGCCLR